jgi:hypothetical protein
MKIDTMRRAVGEGPQSHIARLLALDLTDLTAEEQAELVFQLCAAERESLQDREQLLPLNRWENGDVRERAGA